MSEKQRTRRIGFTLVTPTQENTVGSVKVAVNGGVEAEFSRDLADLNLFMATIFLIGIRDRLANAVSGLTEPTEISETVLEEIDNLNNEVIRVAVGKVKVKNIPDILRAWASLYKEDIEDDVVFAKYTSAWDSRSEEEQKTLRTNKHISAALYEIQAERKKSKVGADEKLPEL